MVIANTEHLNSQSDFPSMQLLLMHLTQVRLHIMTGVCCILINAVYVRRFTVCSGQCSDRSASVTLSSDIQAPREVSQTPRAKLGNL